MGNYLCRLTSHDRNSGGFETEIQKQPQLTEEETHTRSVANGAEL